MLVAWYSSATLVRTAALINLVIVAGVFYRARSWFPASAPFAQDAIGMNRDGKATLWGRVFVVVLTIVNVAITLLRSMN